MIWRPRGTGEGEGSTGTGGSGVKREGGRPANEGHGEEGLVKSRPEPRTGR